jgi:hypothetical protein
LSPPEKKQHDVIAVPDKVDAIAGPEHHSSLKDTLPDRLVVAEVARLKAEHPRLDPGARGDVEAAQPVAERAASLRRNELANGQLGHGH